MVNHWNGFSFQNVLLFFSLPALTPQMYHFTVLVRGVAAIKLLFSLELPPFWLLSNVVYHGRAMSTQPAFYSWYMKSSLYCLSPSNFHTYCYFFPWASHTMFCKSHGQTTPYSQLWTYICMYCIILWKISDSYDLKLNYKPNKDSIVMILYLMRFDLNKNINKCKYLWVRIS